VRTDLRSGEGVARCDVREAHEGMHEGELSRVVEPQSRDAFSRWSNGGLCKPSQLATINKRFEDVLLDVEVVVVDCGKSSAKGFTTSSGIVRRTAATGSRSQ
jgi:hypothetical protein